MSVSSEATPPDPPEWLDDLTRRVELPPANWRDVLTRAIEAADAGRLDVPELAWYLGHVTRWLDALERELTHVTGERDVLRGEVDVATRTIRALSRRGDNWGEYS